MFSINILRVFYVMISILNKQFSVLSIKLSPNFLSKLKAENFIETQYIQTINNQHTFGEKDIDAFLRENEFIKNKKIISISPGGYKGFYMLGISKFIKKTYNLDNYIFTGASAGAWNSLILCFKHDIEELEKTVLDSSLQKIKSISELEYTMKYKIISKYKTEDFDLRRLFIGVTTLSNYKTNTTIFSGFDSLDDAINCCIASSHIPLITGGLTNVYRNIYSFDGGFSKYPYLNISASVLHITPNLWKQKPAETPSPFSVNGYTTLLLKNKYNFKDMIKEGFEKASENKYYLDEIIT